MSDPSNELDALCREFPLPAAWGPVQSFTEVVDVGGLTLFLTGLMAVASPTKSAMGSATQLSSFDLRRAYFELVERAVVLDAIDRAAPVFCLCDASERPRAECPHATVFPMAPAGASFVYSRSNGVAAGPDWESASRAAYFETFERHCVLAAWYGLTRPEKQPWGASEVVSLEPLYDFEVYSFPSPEGPGADGRIVVFGCFGFPKSPGAPFVCGFGAGTDRSSAERRASTECLQRLGFLWGEAIPEAEPPMGLTADFHQELYLWPPMHQRVRDWLSGTHADRGAARRISHWPPLAVDPGFVDLTPPELAGKLRVVKAVSHELLPLTFGSEHPSFVDGGKSQGTHPIA